MQLICDLDEHVGARQIGYVRKELVHHKIAPPVELSVGFLPSYLATPRSIEAKPDADRVKGKWIATICRSVFHTWSRMEAATWEGEVEH